MAFTTEAPPTPTFESGTSRFCTAAEQGPKRQTLVPAFG
jgi:hypothetical protein